MSKSKNDQPNRIVRNGAQEVGANGKFIKSGRNDNQKDVKRRKKSWEYVLEFDMVNNELDSFVNQKAKKNPYNGFFDKSYCLYCKTQLKTGNKSRFCNKKCAQDMNNYGPRED